MDPVLVVLLLTNLGFYIAGIVTHRYVIGGRARNSRNSWAAPRTMEPVEAPEAEPEKTLLEQQLDEIIEYHQERGW